MRITDTAAQTQGIALPARAHTSLSLSLSASDLFSAHTPLCLSRFLSSAQRAAEREAAL